MQAFVRVMLTSIALPITSDNHRGATDTRIFPMKPLLILAAIYAAISIVNHLQPGPGDADVRGKAKTVAAP